MLSIVVPPDFDPEATSSDMMVGEGGQVNIFVLIIFYILSKILILNYQKKLLIINNLKTATFLVIRNRHFSYSAIFLHEKIDFEFCWIIKIISIVFIYDVLLW